VRRGPAPPRGLTDVAPPLRPRLIAPSRPARRLMHRGMSNKSSDVVRPVLQFVYHVPSYVERKNYGTQRLFGD